VSGRPDIELVIPGEPKGKARPRFNRATGSAYTPTSTQRAEQRIQTEWIALGRPVVSGALSIEVEAVLTRPKNHWLKDGTLSTAGARSPQPTKKPDWDNIGKLIADSLNGLAYADDSQIVLAVTVKRWAERDESEHTRIRIAEVAQVAA
jgi:Holliday junction resolvase RusA-like endonuclease